jgi:hypothetical protein
MSEITPGLSVDIIFEKDYDRSTFNLFSAMVYEVSGRKIILSQTSQPLKSQHLQQAVIVTYCIKRNGQTERYGFTAKIAGFLNDYHTATPTNLTAIVLERKSEPEQMNVRLHFRIQPKTDSGLSLLHKGTSMNIIDISLGGAQFSRDTIEPLNPGDTIRLQLKIDERTIDLDAKVARSWITTRAGGTKKIQFLAVRFAFANPALEQLLSNKIMAIERQRLADGKSYR